ncbi:DNA polymerase III [Treponema lecithinolyticum]
MFENILYQPCTALIEADITSGSLPQALLFAGPAMAGKLSAALETARILSCKNTPKGLWQCTCASCLRHKSLVHTETLIAGSRDCTPEIAAASKTLYDAALNNAQYIQAARYLFVRSVRKLTARFTQVLWEGDEKVSKIAAVTSVIDELLEELDPSRQIPENTALKKMLDTINSQCVKLESSFMYDSVPISHIRKASAWARLTAADGMRVLILENVERMQDGVRNALLKILEEPPEQALFILTARRKSAVLPTILSRVRTYTFAERTAAQQSDVVQRIFRNGGNVSYVADYLNGFLPIPPEQIEKLAFDFVADLYKKNIPDVEALVKQFKNFEPRVTLFLFFNGILNAVKKIGESLQAAQPVQGGTYTAQSLQAVQANTVSAAYILNNVKRSYEDITVYNQSPQAALESIVYAFWEQEETYPA